MSATEGGAMQLRQVGGCDDGTCPAVYLADDGSIIVKGDIVSDAQAIADANPTATETLVKVPLSLFASAKVEP
jgi:hypothetical protein